MSEFSIDDAVGKSLGNASAQLRDSVSQALPVNPDKEAETRRYATAAQVPLDTARNMPDEVKNQAQMSSFDADHLAQKFPNTAQWMTAPDNAKLAHDDIPATAAVEQHVTALAKPAAPAPSTPSSLSKAAHYLFSAGPDGGLMGDVGGSIHSVLKGLGGSFNAAGQAINLVGGALPVFYDKAVGGTSASDWWFKTAMDPLTQSAPAFEVGPHESFVQKALHAGGGLMGTLAQITLTGGAGEGAVAAKGADTLGTTIKAATEHGVKAMAFPALTDSVNLGRKVFQETGDGGAALQAATAQWMSTSAMGVMPLSTPGGLGTRLTTGAAAGMATGEASRVGLNAALPDKMKSDFDWENVFLSGLTGSVLAGVMGPHAESRAMAPAVRAAYNEAYTAAKAEHQTQQLVDLAKAATASKLRERDPEAFKQFVKDTADNGDMQGVYIDATKLAEVMQESGVPADELRQTMPEVARQLDEALGENAPRNGLVQIPIEDFATHIAGSKLEKGLMQHLRIEPEGGTVGESEAFAQSRIDDMKAQADRIILGHEGDQAYQASADNVRQDVQARLEGIGMRSDQAAANATPLAEFYRVHADQVGVLPHEFAARYPLNFTNKALEGLNQFAGQGAKTADIGSLDTAQTRIAQGDDAEAVRRATGWHQGADGKWRFEISDHEASVLPALDALKDGGHEAKPIKHVTYRKNSPGRYDVTLTPEGAKAVKDFVTLKDVDEDVLKALLPAKIVKAMKRGAGVDDLIGDLEPAKGLGLKFHFDGMNAIPLDKALGHTRLFDAYPQLRDVLVQVDPKLAIGGAYVTMVDGTRVIRVGKGAQLSTLLHEIQHGVQDIEGFASGGSPKGEQSAYEARVNAELKNLLDGDPALARAFNTWSDFQTAMSNGKHFDATAAAEAESKLQATPDGDKAMDLWGTLDGLSDPDSAPRVMQDRYLRLAGEVEARNTQARASLDEWDRQHTRIDATADTPAGRMLLAQESRGTYSPSAKTISLMKGADLSTFQHELGHFFLDTMAHLSAQADAPASVKADMHTLLKWFGVPDLDSWHQMSLDEQRQFHEQFATGWETYLMKGQAPTLELRTVFQRFRSWMISVYKKLADAPGNFNPEVKGVFDRMIASEAAIHQAELARKYMPLFDTPEKSGMTTEDWAAYQAQGKDATEQAIEGLIGKTMKDMAWMDRLRTASLKSVTADALEKRKAIEREVRPLVMSQPVYRAWSFLTGRGEADQRAAEAASLKVEGVDPSVDSLLVAIAKMGGINRESATKHAGVHKDYHAFESGVFGKPVFRKSGGHSVDTMLDMLAAEHYLPLDEHGRPSASDLEAKISEELGGNHQYSMAHDYGRGDAPPQKLDTTQVAFGKLRTSELHDMFGAGKDATWRRLSDMRMTSEKRGVSPAIVADMFGFHDAHALVKALADAEHPRSVIEGLTDQRMLQEHGELSSPEAVARTADELVQNEVRARFVATELRALTKAVGSAREIAKAAKEVAATTIGAKRIRDIREGQFTAAETRSASQAEKAMAKGDTQGAAVAKRDQLLNMELGRAARNAKDEVAKALTYLAKFDKASTRESIDLEYRDQIDALLDRHDLRKSVTGTALDKREALLAFVERMSEDGYKPQIPERLLDEAARTHYKDMPFADFQGLVDAVKSIEHLGKLKTRLQDLQESRAIGDLADEVKASAGRMPQSKPESNRGLTRMQAAWVKTKSFGRSAEAAMLKMEQMIDWLDARDPNGTLNRVVFRRLSEAGVHENNLLTTVKGEIDKLINSHLADVTREKGKIYVAGGLVDGKTGAPQRFTTKEMLMLAGNMGNESNAAKLAKGENWDQAEVWAFLNANMTNAHWEFVAGMGRVLESLWPEKLAMDRRLGNTSPEKIQPRPFDTPFGRYKGWYWPMMYDPARSQDVADRGAKKADALFENTYATGNTDTGRMNTRNENYARPLLLDLDALPRMIKDEIHDVSHREAVIDADRFMSHPTVRKAIISALSQEHYDQIRPWLQSIANDGKVSTEGGRGMEFFNTIAREARTRATMVGLGFRLTTALVHGSSAGVESIAELGVKWMGSGLKDFANPAQWSANKDFIFERSGEMRNRMNEVDRDIREHLREIDTHLMDPTLGAAARGADHLRAHAYTLIAGLDMATALPTWMGAYKKGMTPVAKGGLGLGEKDAVYFADKTVRNAHGGSGVKDMARVQRGAEFQKLFTMFYTFWNHNFNRIADTARLVASAKHREVMKEANHWTNTQLASTVILRTLVYTLGVQVLHAMLHPPKDGDEEGWLKWAAGEMASSAFAGIPIARDLSSHYITGKDYSATPASSLVNMIGNTGTDLANALTGQEVSDKWLKHTMTTAGAAFNLPLGQPASTAQFLWDVGQGDQHPDSAKAWFNGVMHGTTQAH